MCCTGLAAAHGVPVQWCQSSIFSEGCEHKSKVLLTGHKEPAAVLRPDLEQFGLDSQGQGQQILQHKKQLYKDRALVFLEQKTLYSKSTEYKCLKAQVQAPRSPKSEGHRPLDLLLFN